MPDNRFYLPADFCINEEYPIENEEFHHLVKVMRAKIDDEIELINGKGFLAKATVSSVSSKEAKVKISSFEKEPPKAYKIFLLQALPKQNHLDLIVEKGVELGVDCFLFFPGSRSEKKELKENQIARLHAISLAASKQCGRLTLPSFTFYQKKEALHFSGTLYIGSLKKDAPFFGNIFPENPIGNFCFAIGPEKGFAPEEELFFSTKFSGTLVKLHENILRTETASLAGITLLSHYLQKKI